MDRVGRPGQEALTRLLEGIRPPAGRGGAQRPAEVATGQVWQAGHQGEHAGSASHALDPEVCGIQSGSMSTAKRFARP